MEGEGREGDDEARGEEKVGNNERGRWKRRERDVEREEKRMVGAKERGKQTTRAK